MKVENEERNGHYTVWEPPHVEFGDPISALAGVTPLLLFSSQHNTKNSETEIKINLANTR